MRWGALVIALGLVLGVQARGLAQAKDDAMSDAEVESLRNTAASPMDRIEVYEKMLDAREKQIDMLLAKPKRAGFAEDMHDAMEQFGAIADELNDNLDEYNAKHHDVRKVLPKLIEETERWTTALRAAGEDERFSVVRRIALNTLKDTRALAVETKEAQEAFFKEHPEALKADRARESGNSGPQ